MVSSIHAGQTPPPRPGTLGAGLVALPLQPAPAAAAPPAPPPKPDPPQPPPAAAAQCAPRGVVAARDPAINSGCATPAAARQQYALQGLLPPRQVRRVGASQDRESGALQHAAALRACVQPESCDTPTQLRGHSSSKHIRQFCSAPVPQVSLDVEVARARAALAQCGSDFERHRLLMALKETNRAAFYALLQVWMCACVRGIPCVVMQVLVDCDSRGASSLPNLSSARWLTYQYPANPPGPRPRGAAAGGLHTHHR